MDLDCPTMRHDPIRKPAHHVVVIASGAGRRR